MAARNCVNAAQHQFEKCIINLIDTLQGIKLADDRKKGTIKLLVIYFERLDVCSLAYKMNFSFSANILISKTASLKMEKAVQRSEDQLETVTDFIDSATSNLINLLCGDYTEGSDKCEKLEAAPKKNNSEKRTKSFFLQFVQVF
jgi:hypothetical protein